MHRWAKGQGLGMVLEDSVGGLGHRIGAGAPAQPVFLATQPVARPGNSSLLSPPLSARSSQPLGTQPQPPPHWWAWTLAHLAQQLLPADTKKMPALRMMLCRVL